MKGLLVNNEHSLWYSGNGEIFMSVWVDKVKFLMIVDQMRLLERPTPLQSARPVAFVAVAAEIECTITFHCNVTLETFFPLAYNGRLE